MKTAVKFQLDDQQLAQFKSLVAASGKKSQQEYIVDKVFSTSDQGVLGELLTKMQADNSRLLDIVAQQERTIAKLIGGREGVIIGTCTHQNLDSELVSVGTLYQVGHKLDVVPSAMLLLKATKLKSPDWVVADSWLFLKDKSHTKKAYLTPSVELCPEVAAKVVKEARYTEAADVQRWQEQYQKWLELFGAPCGSKIWSQSEQDFSWWVKEEQKEKQAQEAPKEIVEAVVVQQELFEEVTAPVQEKLNKRQMAERSGLSINQVARIAKAGAVIPVGSDVWVKTGDFWQIDQDSATIEEVAGVQSHG